MQMTRRRWCVLMHVDGVGVAEHVDCVENDLAYIVDCANDGCNEK